MIEYNITRNTDERYKFRVTPFKCVRCGQEAHTLYWLQKRSKPFAGPFCSANCMVKSKVDYDDRLFEVEK